MPSERSSKSARRRRYASEDEESPIPMWKVGLVIAVIVLCFAMLYPTLLRPFFASYFSPPPPQPKHKSSGRPPILPSMVGSRPHPELHPGIRMAGAQGQGSTGGSASKGMLAWFLPIYTVGVVSFLLYTLFKSKKKKRRHRRKYSSEESDSDGLDEIDGYDSGNIKLGKKKLQSLQERLKQTEIAMEKILLQLGAITNEQRESSSNEPSQPEATKEGKNEKYLKELEKALSDFKKLSQKHNIKSKRKKAALNDDTSTDDNTEDDIYEVIEAASSASAEKKAQRDSEVEKEKPMKKTSESTNEDQQAEKCLQRESSFIAGTTTGDDSDASKLSSENKSGTTDDMKKKFRQHKKRKDSDDS